MVSIGNPRKPSLPPISMITMSGSWLSSVRMMRARRPRRCLRYRCVGVLPGDGGPNKT